MGRVAPALRDASLAHPVGVPRAGAVRPAVRRRGGDRVGVHRRRPSRGASGEPNGQSGAQPAACVGGADGGRFPRRRPPAAGGRASGSVRRVVSGRSRSVAPSRAGDRSADPRSRSRAGPARTRDGPASRALPPGRAGSGGERTGLLPGPGSGQPGDRRSRVRRRGDLDASGLVPELPILAAEQAVEERLRQAAVCVLWRGAFARVFLLDEECLPVVPSQEVGPVCRATGRSGAGGGAAPPRRADDPEGAAGAFRARPRPARAAVAGGLRRGA